MRVLFAIVAAIIASPIVQAKADFVGNLAFAPSGCERMRKCKLQEDFGYIDTKGIGWLAYAGDQTDGASIPVWARPYIGGSFDGRFIKAAVIHDHYCNNHVRTWQATHMMFHDALISAGVSRAKAQIMYFAVRTGGPRWLEVIEGVPCPLGRNCISAEQMMRDPLVQMTSVKGKKYVTRKATYGSRAFKSKMEVAHQFMASKGDKVTVEDLARLSQSLEQDDVFDTSGAMVIMNAPQRK